MMAIKSFMGKAFWNRKLRHYLLEETALRMMKG